MYTVWGFTVQDDGGKGESGRPPLPSRWVSCRSPSSSLRSLRWPHLPLLLLFLSRIVDLSIQPARRGWSWFQIISTKVSWTNDLWIDHGVSTAFCFLLKQFIDCGYFSFRNCCFLVPSFHLPENSEVRTLASNGFLKPLMGWIIQWFTDGWCTHHSSKPQAETLASLFALPSIWSSFRTRDGSEGDHNVPPPEMLQ